jgi:hypothetical protein
MLFYYYFGSTNKRKKKNYLTQINNDILIMLYDYDNSPDKKFRKEFKEGFRILKQYQIKEIFWWETNQSRTSDFRDQAWDAILSTEAKRKYEVSSSFLDHKREKTAVIIKSTLDEKTLDEFTGDYRKQYFYKMRYYMEKFHMYHISDTIWEYFNTFNPRKKERVSWDEKNFIIQAFHQNNVNKKRLLKKMDNYSKWVRNQYRDAVVKEKMMYNENGTLQELTEENWKRKVDRLANSAMVPNKQEDLLKLVNFRFNWNGKTEARGANNQFKREHVPVKKIITSNFETPHSANS